MSSHGPVIVSPSVFLSDPFGENPLKTTIFST
jgi:hypothetical protein